MSSLIHVVGWTLVHFLWQGALLALAARGVLRLCRRRSANARYVMACVALAAMLASPVVTARVLMTADSAVASRPPAVPNLAPPGIASTASRGWTNDRILSTEAVSADLEPLLPAMVFAWLAGVAILLIRMAGGLWRVRRLQRRLLAAESSRWQTTAERIASRLGVRAAVHVVESVLVDTPAAIGWLRPVILLPIAAFVNLTPAQAEAILAHELMHIRRHDFVVNVAQTVAETFLFFHPGVWWLSGQLRAEREHCCDDAAVGICGDPVDYATALVELEAGRSRGPALALAAAGGSLSARVRRLLNVPTGPETPSLSWIVTLVLACASAVVMERAYASPADPGAGAAAFRARGARAAEPIASPDTFDWQVQATRHFDIYYYAALTPQLAQIADSAERGYEHVSSKLQHNLTFKVPLILFKTRSDFEQQGIAPEARDAIRRGQVTAFSEPTRDRVVVLVDEQPDQLNHRITHELAHIFAFDIIPRSSSNGRRVPTWIDEGFAEYMAGVWDEDGAKQMRDLLAADRVPKVSALTGNLDAPSLAATAHLGHAVFDFIETEYGKPAVWGLLLAVRRNVVEGVPDVYQAAFSRSPEEFDTAFAGYLRRRFTR
jgi:beta-lactamase regulating signal transducer with metallopeptidase domain